MANYTIEQPIKNKKNFLLKTPPSPIFNPLIFNPLPVQHVYHSIGSQAPGGAYTLTGNSRPTTDKTCDHVDYCWWVWSGVIKWAWHLPGNKVVGLDDEMK